MDYIKLNNNDDHLSLGNLLRIIKQNSINKASAIQTEIFCILFNIDNISDTTVNNYCTGYRAIGNEYKQIYLNYQKKYSLDKTKLIPTINNLISIIEGTIHTYQDIPSINNNDKLKKLTLNLYNLAKNDLSVPQKLKASILEFIKKDNYYEAFSNMLFFIILEKKQPIHSHDLIIETIEDILKNTNISANDLKKYLEITFKEGKSLIPSLKKLAKENNPYALFELGNLEYNGIITGKPNYELAYIYHQKAASYNHPTAYWMLAHIILNNKNGNISEDDIILAWNYLQKAKELNSISALNTIGLCYLSGTNPQKEINSKKAIEYFTKAANNGYIYAYNNLGKIYEQDKDYQKALTYYLLSAKQEESWACNKVGEFYRLGLGVEKDLSLSFKYYTIGANSPIKNRYYWNIINLVKYFFLEGNITLNIKKDLEKSISLLESISNQEEAQILLLQIYYQKYLETKKENDLNKVKTYLSLINLNPSFPIEKKKEIQKLLLNLSYQITIPHN